MIIRGLRDIVAWHSIYILDQGCQVLTYKENCLKGNRHSEKEVKEIKTDLFYLTGYAGSIAKDGPKCMNHLSFDPTFL
jgi:hypothetical protein